MEKKYSIEEIEQSFPNPPTEFRYMPFWFWNHEMVEKEVVRQINEMHETGGGGFFIHPRHGRLTQYMGRRWLENCEAAADCAKELGMWAFLYDEDNWPSGPAGGYITGPYRPENRLKAIVLIDEDTFQAGQELSYKIDTTLIEKEGEIYCAIAIPNPPDYPKLASVVHKQIDVTQFIKNGILNWKVSAEGEEWTVMFFAKVYTSYYHDLNGYLDVMRKESVQEFIDFTHKKYVDYFASRGKKDYIGTVIPGIFTDEPSLSHFGGFEFITKRINFTEELPKVFKQLFGYEFNQVILSMFFETGDIASKHRTDFWTAVVKMYSESFYKQIYDYCDSVGLKTTGHINSEGSFPSHFTNHGDFFECFRYMHYGGCDQLTEKIRPDGIEYLGNLDRNPYVGMANDIMTAPKLASSATHLMRKPKTLVEAYGTSSWNITLGSAKRITDYLVATGCNLFVPHDFAYSEDGYRKQDHPPSFPHQPYFKHWKKLADHQSRLSMIFDPKHGIHQAEILMYYPAPTFWAEMEPDTSALVSFISPYIPFHSDALFRNGFDYDFASERMILEGSITKDKKGNTLVKIADEEFKVLFLGITTCVSEKFAEFCLEFFNKGGKLYACGMLPTKATNIGPSDKVISIFKQIFDIEPKEINEKLVENKISKIDVHFNTNTNGGKAAFVSIPNAAPYKNDYIDYVAKALSFLVEDKNISILKENGKPASYIIHQHKLHDNGIHFYLFANSSKSIEYENVEIILNYKAREITYWNTLTGEISPFFQYRIQGDKTYIYFDFPIQSSHVISVKESKEPIKENEFQAMITQCKMKIDKAELKENHLEATLWSAKGENYSITAEVITPDNVKKQGMVLETSRPIQLNFSHIFKAEPQCVNCAMLHDGWIVSMDIEARNAWGYSSTRIYSQEIYVTALDELIAKNPICMVLDGIIGGYTWGFDTTDMPKGGDLATYAPLDRLSVFVNETNVPIRFNFEKVWMDPCWIVIDISKYLKNGLNHIQIKSTARNHQAFHTLTEPVRFIGDFELSTHEFHLHMKKQRKTVRLGDLSHQGFKRLCGGFAYIQEIKIPGDLKSKKLTLKVEDCKDTIELHVNGKFVDVMWWNYEIDITDHVKFDENNEIKLIYYGIGQNVMQTNELPVGIDGAVKIMAYSKRQMKVNL